MAIPIELQGEGSYEYECKKHDCEYCRAMVVINPDINVAEPVVPEKADSKIKKRNKKAISPIRMASGRRFSRGLVRG